MLQAIESLSASEHNVNTLQVPRFGDVELVGVNTH